MDRKKRSNEQGYILLTLLLATAVIVIGFSRILPSLVQQGKRQKEMDLIYRGQQYQRGIQLFVRKFGRYPNNLEDLEDTNDMRFIRKRYKDPFTKSGDWRLIHIAPDGTFPDSITLGQGGTTAAETGLKPSEGRFEQREENAEEGEEAHEPALRTTSVIGKNPQQPRATGAEQKQNHVIGVGGIAGVASLDTNDSVIVWNKFRKHDQWEFIYDFRQNPLGLQAVQNLFRGGGGAPPPGGQPAGSQDNPTNPNPNPSQPSNTQQPGLPPTFGTTPGFGGGPGIIGGSTGNVGGSPESFGGSQGGFAPTPIPSTTPQQRRP